MNSEPLVSIVMPAFNSAGHIREAINSVLNQNYKNFELLVADGGGGQTERIVADISRFDPRVKYIKNLNDQGPAHARSAAIKSAKGEYVAFLDADDLWLPNKLEVQIDFVKKTGAKFCYSTYREISYDGSLIGPLVPMYDSYTYAQALSRRGIGTLTVLISLDLFTDEILSLWRRAGGEEYIWWLLILRSDVTAKCCRVDVARYRDTPNSLSKNRLYTIRSVWDMYRNVLELDFFKAGFFYLLYLNDSFFRKAYLKLGFKKHVNVRQL